MVVARLLLVVAAALILCATATAATIDDLRALGFSAQISNPGTVPGCPIYYISGYGNSSYADPCTPDGQAVVDSWANPVGFCNVKWQYQHPDQLAAFQSITGKGWSVSGDQCADAYNVTNPHDGTTAYSGSGSGLPGFDAANGAPPASPTSTPSSGGTSAPGFCLPLCPNIGDTRGGGGVLVPAPAPTLALQAATTVAVDAPPATVVDTSSYTVVQASAEETAATGVIGWLNTPYMTTPLVALSA